MTAARIWPFKFRKCLVTKAHEGEERIYTPGETVLWPGEVRIPDWLEVVEVLSDERRSVPATAGVQA